MFESIATLRGIEGRSYDNYGNEIISYNDRVVYVKTRSVYASEYYDAAQVGLNPSIVFELANRSEYADETYLKYNGVNYRIIRVDWNGDRDAIRLVCEQMNNGGESGSY